MLVYLHPPSIHSSSPTAKHRFIVRHYASFPSSTSMPPLKLVIVSFLSPDWVNEVAPLLTGSSMGSNNGEDDGIYSLVLESCDTGSLNEDGFVSWFGPVAALAFSDGGSGEESFAADFKSYRSLTSKTRVSSTIGVGDVETWDAFEESSVSFIDFSRAAVLIVTCPTARGPSSAACHTVHAGWIDQLIGLLVTPCSSSTTSAILLGAAGTDVAPGLRRGGPLTRPFRASTNGALSAVTSGSTAVFSWDLGAWGPSCSRLSRSDKNPAFNEAILPPNGREGMGGLGFGAGFEANPRLSSRTSLLCVELAEVVFESEAMSEFSEVVDREGRAGTWGFLSGRTGAFRLSPAEDFSTGRLPEVGPMATMGTSLGFLDGRGGILGTDWLLDAIESPESLGFTGFCGRLGFSIAATEAAPWYSSGKGSFFSSP